MTGANACSYCGTRAGNCPNDEGEACCMGCYNLGRTHAPEEPCMCGTPFTCLAVHHDTNATPREDWRV